jgi:murein DD-endopeptidase MepM/ murein hydrolase activator NlpD
MNLILVTRRHGTARHINLRHPVNLLIMGLGLGLILAAAFFVGQFSAGGPEEQLAAWRAELDSQEQLLKETRKASQEKIDALSVKLAQMNAQVIRLEALGRRLTQMANLDDGEFNFDSSPALGGPEPEVPGRSVAMPDMEFLLDTLAVQIQDRHRQLNILEDLMLNRTLSDEVHPEGRPVNAGWISSYFGQRTDPFTGKSTRHKGVDFAGKEGAEVIAVASGVVTWSGDRYGYGEMVEINHGNGYSTRYAHNSKNLVVVGDEVSRGQVVSLMGRTGRATGPNLHFEVVRGGRKVDPLEYIRGTR